MVKLSPQVTMLIKTNMKPINEYIKEYQDKYVDKAFGSNGGYINVLKTDDADEIESFLQSTLEARDREWREKVLELIQKRMKEDDKLGHTDIKPTQMFDRGYNSALLMIKLNL
jgi:hypothetical protein